MEIFGKKKAHLNGTEASKQVRLKLMEIIETKKNMLIY